MSSIYFIVDNKLSKKMRIHVRGNFPNLYFTSWEEIAAGERKELSHKDSRGALSTRFGYGAEFEVWDQTFAKGELIGEGWRPTLAKANDAKESNFLTVDLDSFKDAPGGDINVTLTPTAQTVENGRRVLAVKVSASIR